MEALDLPLGHVMTMINIRLITQGAKRGMTKEDQENDFWELLERE